MPRSAMHVLLVDHAEGNLSLGRQGLCACAEALGTHLGRFWETLGFQSSPSLLHRQTLEIDRDVFWINGPQTLKALMFQNV
jgi:hypothetical protein